MSHSTLIVSIVEQLDSLLEEIESTVGSCGDFDSVRNLIEQTIEEAESLEDV